jgi:hypothetical protein
MLETHLEIMSPKYHIPNRDAATPLTADDTMCVIGEVILMDRRLARLIIKPMAPCHDASVSNHTNHPRWTHTVIKDPQMNVCSSLSSPSTEMTSVCPKNNSIIAGTSPANMMSGIIPIALNRLVYHDKFMALPLTTSRLFLMTTLWTAVIAELATPKPTPKRAMGTASRKTPTKKPSVTTEQLSRMRRDGRAERKKQEVRTVKGRTRPRATW